MSEHDRTSDPAAPSGADAARPKGETPGGQDLPPVQGDPADQPGTAGSPHRGQSGRGGSGDDAEIQSVGQSQSDRAAGSSS